MQCARRRLTHGCLLAAVAALVASGGAVASAQGTAGIRRPGAPSTTPPSTIRPQGSGVSGGIPSTDQLRGPTGGSAATTEATSGAGSLRGASGGAFAPSNGASADLATPSADRGASPAADQPPSTGRFNFGGGSPPLDRPYDASPLPTPRGPTTDRPDAGGLSGSGSAPLSPGGSGQTPRGWGLAGPSGRHYVFGDLAVADYRWQGERHIVTLELETNLPKEDPNFLYYRETRDGHRWALATHAGPDRMYSVYFQPQSQPVAGGKPTWRRFQRAELLQSGAESAQMVGLE